MKVQTGNRKFIGFMVLVAAFLVICLAVLILAVILKGDRFNMTEFGGLFIPLATALMLIGAPFFAANATVHALGGRSESVGEKADGNA